MAQVNNRVSIIRSIYKRKIRRRGRSLDGEPPSCSATTRSRSRPSRCRGGVTAQHGQHVAIAEARRRIGRHPTPWSCRLGDGWLVLELLTRRLAGQKRLGTNTPTASDLTPVQIKPELCDFLVHHRCLHRHQVAARRAAPARSTCRLDLPQFVADAATEPDLKRLRRTPPCPRHLGVEWACAERVRLGPKRLLDQAIEIVGRGDIAAQTEEHITQRPALDLLDPDTTIEERGDLGNATVDRSEATAVGLHANTFTRLGAEFQFPERQAMAVE